MAEKKAPNIEAFNTLTARILSDLYAAFPRQIELDGLRIALQVSESNEANGAEYLATLHELADETVSFLIDEGFIQSAGTSGGQRLRQHHACRLTLKGFAILGTVPRAVDETQDRRSLGTQLGEALEQGAVGSAGELVQKVLTGAVQVAVGALGAFS